MELEYLDLHASNMGKKSITWGKKCQDYLINLCYEENFKDKEFERLYSLYYNLFIHNKVISIDNIWIKTLLFKLKNNKKIINKPKLICDILLYPLNTHKIFKKFKKELLTINWHTLIFRISIYNYLYLKMNRDITIKVINYI